MRKSSAILTTLVAASALAVAWRIGDLRVIEGETGSLVIQDITSSAYPSITPSSEPNPSPSSSTTPTKAPQEPNDSGKKPKPSKSPSTKPTEVSVISDVIDYKYGVLQLQVTMVGQQITDIAVLQGETSNGRAQAYDILSKATIQVQGTDYGNVSGATFTTEAFKKAISNALAKF